MNIYAIAGFIFGFVVSMIWPHQTRRFLLIILFGIPGLLFGYLFGYLQSGWMTGLALYNRYDAKGRER
jgi:hypothetical protein